MIHYQMTEAEENGIWQARLMLQLLIDLADAASIAQQTAIDMESLSVQLSVIKAQLPEAQHMPFITHD